MRLSLLFAFSFLIGFIVVESRHPRSANVYRRHLYSRRYRSSPMFSSMRRKTSSNPMDCFIVSMDHALLGTAFAAPPVNNLKDCLNECLKRTQCRSVLHYKDRNICVLNNRNRDEKRTAWISTHGLHDRSNYYERICYERRSPVVKAASTASSSDCFQIENGKVLIGVFDKQLKGIKTIDKCQKACEDSQKSGGIVCKSAMFYEKDQECILASSNKNDVPGLYVEDEKSTYIENKCFAGTTPSSSSSSDQNIAPNNGGSILPMHAEPSSDNSEQKTKPNMGQINDIEDITSHNQQNNKGGSYSTGPSAGVLDEVHQTAHRPSSSPPEASSWTPSADEATTQKLKLPDHTVLPDLIIPPGHDNFHAPPPPPPPPSLPPPPPPAVEDSGYSTGPEFAVKSSLGVNSDDQNVPSDLGYGGSSSDNAVHNDIVKESSATDGGKDSFSSSSTSGSFNTPPASSSYPSPNSAAVHRPPPSSSKSSYSTPSDSFVHNSGTTSSSRTSYPSSSSDSFVRRPSPASSSAKSGYATSRDSFVRRPAQNSAVRTPYPSSSSDSFVHQQPAASSQFEPAYPSSSDSFVNSPLPSSSSSNDYPTPPPESFPSDSPASSLDSAGVNAWTDPVSPAAAPYFYKRKKAFRSLRRQLRHPAVKDCFVEITPPADRMAGRVVRAHSVDQCVDMCRRCSTCIRMGGCKTVAFDASRSLCAMSLGLAQKIPPSSLRKRSAVFYSRSRC